MNMQRTCYIGLFVPLDGAAKDCRCVYNDKELCRVPSPKHTPEHPNTVDETPKSVVPPVTEREFLHAFGQRRNGRSESLVGDATHSDEQQAAWAAAVADDGFVGDVNTKTLRASKHYKKTLPWVPRRNMYDYPSFSRNKQVRLLLHPIAQHECIHEYMHPFTTLLSRAISRYVHCYIPSHNISIAPPLYCYIAHQHV
jgi:hypothetical protein